MTIIEVLVAMTILLVGVMSAVALIDRANAATVKTRAREAATNVARELIEAARGVPYTNLTPASIEGEIQALPGLADDGAPAGWTIRRRGFTYTVTAQVCAFDDGRDGGGDHDAGAFCTDSVAPTTPPDTSPEDYKRVRIDVTWQQGSGTSEVHQTELINNPGSAGGPAVRTLTLNGSAAPPAVTNPATQNLTFQLTTSSTPHALHWLLDGSSQGSITTGSGKAWSFPWALGVADAADSVLDGTYLVSAEAFDRYGVAGPSKSITVSLNRTPADKVIGVVGGRTGDPAQPEDQVVDIEWLPGNERDIVGYEVYRLDGATRTVVCELSKATTCIDRDPPNEDELTYLVVAFDSDSATAAPRSGPDSDPLTVRKGNQAPDAPLNLSLVTLPDGDTRLTWERPGPFGDPDAPNDTIDFYRIYRDGVTYEDRYARWDVDTVGIVDFVDSNTGGLPHKYWVTSVDRNYGESAPVGPVTG
jgi:type II secretory pathway pseudopilin PulG